MTKITGSGSASGSGSESGSISQRHGSANRIHTKMSWIRSTARYLRYSVMITYEYDEVGEEQDELNAHAHEALHCSTPLFLVSAK